MHPYEEAFLPIFTENRRRVLEDTWGHLAPKKNKKYSGYILFCQTSGGLIVSIDYNFEGLGDSPWLCNSIEDFIAENVDKKGIIYKWEGNLKNYQFSGEIKIINYT